MAFFRQAFNFGQDKWNADRVKFISYSAAISAVVISGSIFVASRISKYKQKRQLKKYEGTSCNLNKVILHIPPTWDLPTPNASPACAKMVAYFHYTKIPFIIDNKLPFHPFTKKTPWITYKNKHIADSNIIIEYISSESSLNNINIDNHLNKSEISILNAFRSLIEDCLYFIIIYRRWYENENVYEYTDMLLKHIPKLIKIMIRKSIIKMVRKQIWSQGTARLSSDNIYKRGSETIESIINYIGDKKFFFGNKLSSLDLTIYGHVGGMYQVPWKWKYKNGLIYKKEINEYMKRIEIECYGKVVFWKDIV